jgi:hypothetical protein
MSIANQSVTNNRDGNSKISYGQSYRINPHIIRECCPYSDWLGERIQK